MPFSFNPDDLAVSLAALDCTAVVADAIALQQIAAPTFAEAPRASEMYKRFSALGLANISFDALGNVVARLPGASAAPVLVTAHLDTVFEGTTDLHISRDGCRITGPGIGDNSLGLAGLLELARVLQTAKLQLPGDLWLAANVGEEGLGDLRGMRQLHARFGKQASATIVVEGAAYGRVIHRAVGARHFRISAQTAGGHSWNDAGLPSAIHELVRCAGQLLQMRLSTEPRVTLNIGRITGGTSINTIAGSAQLELDLRSEDNALLEKAALQAKAIMAGMPASSGVKLTCEECGNRPTGAIVAHHPLPQLALAALKHVGHTGGQLCASSTDANIPLSAGCAAVCIGLCGGGNAHRTDEFIDTTALAAGLAQLLLVVRGAFDIPVHQSA